MSKARSSSTQFPEIMMAPVGSPVSLARASWAIQAFIMSRDSWWTFPWYWRSLTSAGMVIPLVEEH